MDAIEQAIWDAWRRIAPTLRNDEQELARRIARRRCPLLLRPPRAWCLAIRANDTRVPTQADARSSPASHSVMLDAEQLRDLCRPVRIPWPGERSTEVAAMLGRTPMGLRDARINGLFQFRHIKGLDGSRGRPVPILYTDRPLDPAARTFAAADPVWAWTAESTIARIPDDLFTAIQRVPTFRPSVSRHRYDEHAHPEVVDAAGVITTSAKRRHRRLPAPEPDHVWYKWSRSGHYLGDDPTNWRKTFQDLGERPPRFLKRDNSKRLRRPSTSRGSLWFHGWAWLCPACGKTCRTLYLPLPPLHHFLASEEPRFAQLADIPRKLDGFACRKCHRVKFFSRVQSEAWNDTIAYLTGGLLYGSEVPRPRWFTKDRKRPYKPLLNARPAIRREQVEQRLLDGQTRAQIAADLHMTLNAVSQQISKIYRQHGTRRSQRALLRKHKRPLPAHLLPRREQVRQHILAGLSQPEISQEMSITKQAVQTYTSHLRKLGELPRPKLKRDAVAALHSAGLSPKRIAATLGLARQNIYDHLHELREANRLPQLTRAADRQTLLRLLLTDLTLKEIGQRMGQKLGTIGARAARIYRAEGVKNRREFLRTRRGMQDACTDASIVARGREVQKPLHTHTSR